MRNKKLRCLCEGAIMVAIAQVLGYLKIWHMPWGGSVTLIMLPLVFFAIRWGLLPGLGAGFALGILQFLFDGGLAIGWQSILGDYIFAYAAVGLAGLMHGRKAAWCTGTVIGGLARLSVHFLVGATVWAEYMPEEFLGMAMSSPWVYSLIYNLLYMLPNIAVTLIPFAIMAKPLKKYISGADYQVGNT